MVERESLVAARFSEWRRRIAEARSPLRMVLMAHEAEGLLDDFVKLRVALKDVLSVCERTRGGDKSLDPEEWFLVRDYARIVLHDTEMY